MNHRATTARERSEIARRIATAAMVFATLASASGCAKTPAPDAAGTVTTSSEESSATRAPAAVAAAEQAALELVKGASTYEPSMNARVIREVKQRLQYNRGANLTVAVRIDREGAPVDLYFLRRTGELRSVAFGTKDGRLLQNYDQFAVSTGDQALDLVEQLAEQLPKQP